MQRMFVVVKNKKPLGPCRPARARMLLRDGKAAVQRRYLLLMASAICTNRPDLKEETAKIKNELAEGCSPLYIRMVCLSLLICSVFVANITFAGEQMIVFNVNSYKVSYSNFAARCETECESYNKPLVQNLLADGWRVVSTSPREMSTTKSDYRCVCDGTQYVLQKESPVSQGDELLKKENELLKREIELLKKENDDLKNKSKQRQKKQ